MNTANKYKALNAIKNQLKKTDPSSLNDNDFFFNSIIYGLTQYLLGFYTIHFNRREESYLTCSFTRAATEGQIYLMLDEANMIDTDDKHFFRLRCDSLLKSYKNDNADDINNELSKYMKERGIKNDNLSHPFFFIPKLQDIKTMREFFDNFTDNPTFYVIRVIYDCCSFMAHDYPFMESVTTKASNNNIRKIEKEQIDIISEQVIKKYQQKYGQINYSNEPDFRSRNATFVPDAFVEYLYFTTNITNDLQDCLMPNKKYFRLYDDIISMYQIVCEQFVALLAENITISLGMLFKSCIEFLATAYLIKDKVKKELFDNAYRIHLNYSFVSMAARNDKDKYNDFYDIASSYDGEDAYEIYKSIHNDNIDYKTFLREQRLNNMFFILGRQKISFRNRGDNYIKRYTDNNLQKSMINLYHSGIEFSHFMYDLYNNEKFYKTQNFNLSAFDHLNKIMIQELEEMKTDLDYLTFEDELLIDEFISLIKGFTEELLPLFKEGIRNEFQHKDLKGE